MASAASKTIRATLMSSRDAPALSLAEERQAWEMVAAQVVLPSTITVEGVDTVEVVGEWISTHNTASQQVLLYLHGGGYSAGSCVTHRELAARMCLASGARVFVLHYRLAPEHSFPAAVEDAAAGYRWLLAQGIEPQHIVIGGDSAGGGLALATMLWLRAHEIALPVAGVLLSPWVDLALRGASMQTRAALDPVTSVDALRYAAAWYVGNQDLMQPLASPLYGDLHDLPPLLIQVGDHEVLLDDATRLAERATQAGVKVTLEIWDEMWHVWHASAEVLPEGRQAIERIGVFMRQHSARAGEDQ